MCEKGCSHVAGYFSAQCGGRWDGTRCPAGGIGVPAVQCVWHVGKHATRIAYPNARRSHLHVRDDKFVIKVSRQALYPGHTLRGAHSVHCKPALAGFWRVNCFASQSACWLLESHVAMCWLLAIGITDCQASQARWWGIGFGVVSAFVLFVAGMRWIGLFLLPFRGLAMDMVHW